MHLQSFRKRHFWSAFKFSLHSKLRIYKKHNSVKFSHPFSKFIVFDFSEHCFCNFTMNFLKKVYSFYIHFILTGEVIIFRKCRLFLPFKPVELTFNSNHDFIILLLLLKVIAKRNSFTKIYNLEKLSFLLAFEVFFLYICSCFVTLNE